MLAALNHPNIATIHGLERVDGVCALVLEVVEGETLDERLRRSRRSAAARGARHRAADRRSARGCTRAAESFTATSSQPTSRSAPTAYVKVLDFGLAKVSVPAGGRSRPGGDADSPTVDLDAFTRAGTVLGTAAYMSPEQAQGKRVDRRPDIWAFGVVLYEMLTGRRGFEGETAVEVLSNVLKAEPDWTALPPATAACCAFAGASQSAEGSCPAAARHR